MWLEVVRDIAIALLAIESIVIGIVLIMMLLQLRSLAKMLREEILPIIESANDTASTVKGTANFVSRSVVTPLVEATSYVTGASEMLRNLVYIRRRPKRGPSEDESSLD